jgi:hypothetical protein
MDTRLFIIVAVAIVIVIAIVAYIYREEIGLKFKGWGVQAALHAKGGNKAQSGSRNVSIGGNATDARIVTGDDAPAKKPTAGAGRNVSIGGSAEGSTIVTGDRKGIV